MAMSRLKPSGRIGDNMKKKLGVLTVVILLVSVCLFFFVRQPKNIFDEIYQETEKSYQVDNIFGKNEDIIVRPVWPSDNESLKYSPHVTYKDNIFNDYRKIVLGFNFQNLEQTSFIRFDKYIDSGVRIRVRVGYSYREKSLKKDVEVIVIKGNSENYIDNESQVKSYLEQYGITAKDLDSYYGEIVNQKVLKDWCTIYDSKYSPSNYGDVKIETQWENW